MDDKGDEVVWASVEVRRDRSVVVLVMAWLAVMAALAVTVVVATAWVDGTAELDRLERRVRELECRAGEASFGCR